MAQNRYKRPTTGSNTSTKVGVAPEPPRVVQGSRVSLSQVGGIGTVRVQPHGDQRIINNQPVIERKPTALDSVGGFCADIGKGAYREVEAYHPGYFTGD